MKKIERKEDDEAICLFAGLLVNPDMVLCLSTTLVCHELS